VSCLYGGWRQPTKYVYETGAALNGDELFVVDSSSNNVGKIAPRHYYGADMQVVLNHSWGKTEWRAEYWRGTQPGNAISTTNPGIIPVAPVYIREFDGAFFYFLQDIINAKHQLIVKYDWYDPNTKISAKEIGKPNTNFTLADIKYSTLGLGYTYYFNSHIKTIIYYEFVRNEETQLEEYAVDKKDNIFTWRLQFRF